MNPQLSPIPPGELRIGNWVTKLETAELAYRIKTGAEIDGMYWPVPLTEEVIKSISGFEYTRPEDEDNYYEPGDYEFYHMQDDCELQYSAYVKNSEVVIRLKNPSEPKESIGLPIRYVHQLQNVHMGLTGTELPLELDNIPLQEG